MSSYNLHHGPCGVSRCRFNFFLAQCGNWVFVSNSEWRKHRDTLYTHIICAHIIISLAEIRHISLLFPLRLYLLTRHACWKFQNERELYYILKSTVFSGCNIFPTEKWFLYLTIFFKTPKIVTRHVRYFSVFFLFRTKPLTRV